MAYQYNGDPKYWLAINAKWASALCVYGISYPLRYCVDTKPRLYPGGRGGGVYHITGLVGKVAWFQHKGGGSIDEQLHLFTKSSEINWYLSNCPALTNSRPLFSLDIRP